jgi:hypothetical protein
VAVVDIVAAVFIEGIDLRAEPGPSTKIDLTGVHFSSVAPSPPPVTIEPHLVVLVRCHDDEDGTGALEVTYHRGDEQIARNIQPLQVDPGKFGYRLVRAELTFDDYGTVEARARIGAGPVVEVPLSLLPPID